MSGDAVPRTATPVDGNRIRWLFTNYGFSAGRDCEAPDDDRLSDFIEDLRQDFRAEAASPVPLDTLDHVLSELREEVGRARARHAPMNSPHEGWAVIREELDPELWEHVCGDTGRSPEARKEALQVAAMGVRYILDLIDDPPPTDYDAESFMDGARASRENHARLTTEEPS